VASGIRRVATGSLKLKVCFRGDRRLYAARIVSAPISRWKRHDR
jgi:hypothetical protein